MNKLPMRISNLAYQTQQTALKVIQSRRETIRETSALYELVVGEIKEAANKGLLEVSISDFSSTNIVHDTAEVINTLRDDGFQVTKVNNLNDTYVIAWRRV